MSGSLKRLLNRYKNGSANRYKDGDWEIAKGGYDLWFEIYYQGIAKIQCVGGTIEVGNIDNINVEKCLNTIKEVLPYCKISEETNYINSISGLAESITDGMNTPIDDCIPEEEVNW